MRSNHKSKGGLGCGEAGAVVPPSLAPPAASVGVAPPPTGTAKAGNGSRGVESNSKILATLGLRQGELARVLKNDAPTPVVTLLTRTAYRMVKNQTWEECGPSKETRRNHRRLEESLDRREEKREARRRKKQMDMGREEREEREMFVKIAKINYARGVTQGGSPKSLWDTRASMEDMKPLIEKWYSQLTRQNQEDGQPVTKAREPKQKKGQQKTGGNGSRAKNGKVLTESDDESISVWSAQSVSLEEEPKQKKRKRKTGSKQSKAEKKKELIESDDEPITCYVGVEKYDVAKLMKLKVVASLTELGIRREVDPDGNCGHRACHMGLEYVGIHAPSRMTEYRREIHEFVLWMREGTIPLYEKCLMPDGSPIDEMKYREPNKRYPVPDWLDKVWQKGVNFDNGAAPEHWFDNIPVLTSCALKYRKTFVSYQVETRKSTNIFLYDEEIDKVTWYSADGVLLKPPPGSICVIFDGLNHFEYLQLHDVKEKRTVGDLISGLRQRLEDEHNIKYGVPRGAKETCL